jgi:predicted PhzF superfamily epimerase YddE/YHI9
MATLHVLKVFIGEGGRGGNLLGVFLDGQQVPEEERQRVTADLGFSETVFLQDRERGELRIFTPGMEIPFAGHPLVGTAWLLAQQEGRAPKILRPPAGEIPVRIEEELTFVRGKAQWAPPFEQIELGSPDEVDALEGPPQGHDFAGVWAWEDQEGGRVRVRVFAPAAGVPEDEASGSNAVVLATMLGRSIRIRQGKGSLILAEPRSDGSVEIGGRTELVEVREYEGTSPS